MISIRLFGLFIAIAIIISGNECSTIPESLQDFQTEYYLPYSKSEDVDFTLFRPEGFGCFKWSVEDKLADRVRLETHTTDKKLNCGNRVLMQIIAAKSEEKKLDFILTGENVETKAKHNKDTNTDMKLPTGIPSSVKYTIHIREVAKLEILGLNTELTAGSSPQPFSVVGYDQEGHEFDTLDGLQIEWLLGSRRNVAEFQKKQNTGPNSHIIPTGAGTGGVIAFISDDIYKHLQPAVMQFSVKSPIEFEPPNLVLLKHGKAPITVFEWMTSVNGDVSRASVVLGTGDKDEFEIEVANPDIVRIDGFGSGACHITALKDGSTDLLLKNRVDGEVWKRHHVTVTTVDYSNIKASNPRHNRINQRQLTNGDVYDLEVELFTKHGMKIYPSENIKSLMDVSDNIIDLEFEDNRLHSKVQIGKGIGFMNASNTLKSIVGENEKEYELPHVHSKVVFEAWDPIELEPEEFVLPYDANMKQSYTLVYKVKGGDETFAYNISNSDLASSSQETESAEADVHIKMRDGNYGSIVKTHGGPGTFEVVAYMPNNPDDNQDNATVHLSPVSRIDFNPKQLTVEFQTSSDIKLGLKMTTTVNGNETAMFHNCHAVPYEILLSDEDNFKGIQDIDRTRVLYGEGRRTMNHRRSVYEKDQECTAIRIKQLTQKPGLLAEVGIKYEEPLSGQVLRARKVISTFEQLRVLHPKPKGSHQSKVVLPVGSSSDIVMKGGPLPWKKLFGKNVTHFKNITINDVEYNPDNTKTFKIVRNEVASGDDIEENLVDDDKAINDLHVYTVTCMDEGSGKFGLIVGNHDDPTDYMSPTTNHIEVQIICTLPSKLNIRFESDNIVQDSKGNVFADNSKETKVSITVKDKNGNTFDNVQSLKFEKKFSADDLMDESKSSSSAIFSNHQFNEFSNIQLPGKPFYTLVPTGKEGSLDVNIKLAGYDEKELKNNGIENPPPLPKVIDDEEDYDEEEEEEYVEHNHDLTKSLTVKLVSPDKINRMKNK